MITLRCKVCGGQIEVKEMETFGICDSCGNKTSLRKSTDEQREILHNRGNAFRMRGEFDKAQSIFERLIDQDDQDVEALWCLLLCRYGIEYVEDPNTHTYIPTSHRISYSSILQDSDYEHLLELADTWMRETYILEGKRIADLQKRLLSVSKSEEAYDIFICYKETQASGTRTKDSKLAQEIYYELVKQGYRVFFSRISLEEKLGEEYEPYIFAALTSAKIMLVIGTSSENFNAVWVKNEWSRYLVLMKNERQRLLIPCYRDMEAMDLPDELSMFQAQDMGKIGFIQDLLRGINKVLNKKTEEEVLKVNSEENIDRLSRLLKNGNILIELKDYKRALEVFKQIIIEYPDCSNAWWGLIISETHNFVVFDKNANGYVQHDLINRWYINFKNLCDKKNIDTFENLYINYVIENSKLALIEENQEIQNQIIKDNQKIEELNVKINKIENSKKQLTVDFEKEDRSDEEHVTKLKIELKKSIDRAAKFDSISKMFKIPFFLSLLLFSISIFTVGGNNFSLFFVSYFFIAITGVGFIIIWILKKLDNTKNTVKSYNEYIDRRRSDILNRKNRFHLDIDKLNLQLNEFKDSIIKMEDIIHTKKALLNYNDYDRVQLLVAKRCEKVGINRGYKIELEELVREVYS